MKKIKLYENFPPACSRVFPADQFDAHTVVDEKLSESYDESIFAECKKENRILITFDLDFANIIRFPAHETPDIVVCRLKKPVNLEEINSLCHRLVAIIAEQNTQGNLLIVEENKLRIRKPEGN